MQSPKYSEKLKVLKNANMGEAIHAAHGDIDGVRSVVAAFNFQFIGGSMGMHVGEAIVTAAEYAVNNGLPFIVVPASGGARMQEGVLALMQMARTTAAINELKKAGLPYIVILTNPTTGGVSASFAMLGDIHIAEPKAMIGFTGARVIAQTVRQKLPDGFQTSEYLLDHGMVDLIVHRKQMKTKLGVILRILLKRV